MSVSLKPLDQQVIVITGASSGIGLATAERAAEAGAKVVLTARSEETLREVSERLNANGGDTAWVAADVSRRDQVERVVETALQRYGRIDTWINDAGVAIYGRLDEVSEEDSRRLFETNYWGVVNGSLAALPHLRSSGGALINIGSEVSDAVMPLLGHYSASKHAVKGFTDALRVEIEDVDKAEISITLIQPTAVDTPFPQHARNYMEEEPKLPPPTLDPYEVADAILEAAVEPTRNKRVGAMATLNTMTAKLAPGLGDKMSAMRVDQQQYDEPPRNPEGALHHAGNGGDVYGSGGAEK